MATLLVLSACAVSIDREGFIEREEKRFPASTVVELHLITFDGSIEIRSWDRPEATIEIEKRGRDKDAVAKIQVLASQQGNRIDVEARYDGTISGFGLRSFTSPSARFLVTVPRKTNLVVRSGDGSVLVERVEGRLELRTADGSIKAIETGGDLLAETNDGSLQIDDVTGHVEARTSDGSVRLSGTPEVVRVRSGDGSVIVRIRHGARMSGDWMIATGDGSVVVELPDGFDGDLEADPGSDGRVRSELTLTDVVGGTRSERVLRGRLGAGGHAFVIRTGDGSIRLTNY
jgi:Toastrack DUF4097